MAAVIGLRANPRRRRYREILSALSRHGLGAFVNEAGWGRLVPFQWGLMGHARRDSRYTTAEHIRLAMEELGTTAIKLGQILSTRPDFVAPDYIAEFEKLRDRVPAVPADAIIAIIERELGGDVADLFLEFEHEPLAAASIGQVHGAVLLDGTRVVVKVQKPGVAATVFQDLAILGDLARRASGGQLASSYDLEALVDDFAWTLRCELDYIREGRNADRLRVILASNPALVVPAIRWQLTTENVLVMERMEGVRLAGSLELPPGANPRALAKAGAEGLLTQVFEAGFFHADPHPGNFLVTPDGRLAILDFGMVGYLDDQLKFQLMQLLDACVRQDATAAVYALETLGVLRTAASRETVRRDLQHLLDSYYGLTLSQVDFSRFLSDLLSTFRRNHLQLPTGLALMLKTTAMSESLWRRLDPDFNFALVAEPFAKRARSRRSSAGALRHQLTGAARQSAIAAMSLPGQVGRIASRLDRGELEIALRHRDLDEYLDRVGGMVARLGTAIVASSLMVGVAIIGAAEDPPGWGVIAPLWFAGGTIAIIGLAARSLLFRRRRNRH
ncbi:MAG: 2-polyprenylphenol hydroxylase [Anaerolinea sp.]|nr:2-polyprenylphenol hydroxylase [Anaerolinea sp.]